MGGPDSRAPLSAVVPQMIRTGLRSPFLPVLLLIVVVGLDAVAQRRWNLLAEALLDEPAHLATALLVLTAAAGPGWLLSHKVFTVSASIASVAIDVDHIPLYARVPHIAVDGGRPFTHSLATVVLLVSVAFAARRARTVALGLATGVVLHLFRDLASGPGVSLFWPLSATRMHLPYGAYLTALFLLAAIGTVRAVLDSPASSGARSAAGSRS